MLPLQNSKNKKTLSVVEGVFIMLNYAIEKLHLKRSEKLVEMNTNAYVNTIKKNPIDVLTHVNYPGNMGVYAHGKQMCNADMTIIFQYCA